MHQFWIVDESTTQGNKTHAGSKAIFTFGESFLHYRVFILVYFVGGFFAKVHVD